MSTTLHEGDTVMVKSSGRTAVVRGHSHPFIRIQLDGSDLIQSYGRETIHLVRRASEPEFPVQLPPLDAPDGRHWMYQGMGWKKDTRCDYMVSSGGKWGFRENQIPEGLRHLHYAELVDNEPYTPPAHSPIEKTEGDAQQAADEIDRLRTLVNGMASGAQIAIEGQSFTVQQIATMVWNSSAIRHGMFTPPQLPQLVRDAILAGIEERAQVANQEKEDRQ